MRAGLLRKRVQGLLTVSDAEVHHLSSELPDLYRSGLLKLLTGLVPGPLYFDMRPKLPRRFVQKPIFRRVLRIVQGNWYLRLMSLVVL